MLNAQKALSVLFKNLGALGFLRIAACSPKIFLADPMQNAEEILRHIVAATKKGVQVLLFPELSLTGYTCKDLFLKQSLQDAAVDALKLLLSKTAGTRTVFAVGLPLKIGNSLYNCMAVCSAGKILGIVPKTHLTATGEFEETRWFASAKHLHISEIKLFGTMVPIGTDLIFADAERPEVKICVVICEDDWRPNSPRIRYVLNGATVVLNPSASTELLKKAGFREPFFVARAAEMFGTYVYASSGPTESVDDNVYGGHKFIVHSDAVVARSLGIVDFEDMIIADVDLGRTLQERSRVTEFGNLNDCRVQTFNLATLDGSSDLFMNVSKTPFVPEDERVRGEDIETFVAITAAGLARRMATIAKVGSKLWYVALSGGQDSTLAALIAKKAAQLAMSLYGESVTLKAITMPGTGTSENTLVNARIVAQLLQVEIETHSIVDSIHTILQELGHEWCGRCYKCENIQPKLRTLFAMLEGNLIGTGHIYDAYVGNTTLYGDHASMYNILAGTSKTFIPVVLRWYAKQYGGELATILNAIANLPPSAELLPLAADGEVEQLTEEVMGPIELMEFFLYHDFRFGPTARKLIFLAAVAFGDEYSADELLYWLGRAYDRFQGQRFKQLSIPPGIMVGSVSHSPRGPLRMPSDALPNVWLAEVHRLAHEIGLPEMWVSQTARRIQDSRKK